MDDLDSYFGTVGKQLDHSRVLGFVWICLGLFGRAWNEVVSRAWRDHRWAGKVMMGVKRIVIGGRRKGEGFEDDGW